MTFKKKEKQGVGRKTSTRQLMGIKAITEYGLETDQHGALVYFIVQPTNLSVLSENSIGARIYALMNVLKGVAEIEMLALNSSKALRIIKTFCRNGFRKKRILQ